MIDYAHPSMMAERALANLHKLMLERNYDEAIDAGIEALTETRMAINAIKHMKEQDNALRKQTASV